MLKKISKYWLFQIGGWSANVALSIFFVFTLEKFSLAYFESILLTCIAGVLVTHAMRAVFHGINIIQKPFKKQLLLALLLTVVFAMVFGTVSEFLDHIINYNPENRARYSSGVRILLSSFNALWIILIWNFIYFLYHFVERNRLQVLDTLRLEATVKELELKTIKSHINPHFIFNALNSIRALVDENPQRARTAITELSNILRSSLRAENEETVPLHQELDIVTDYLALEHMRFEERLIIEMNIGDNTKYQPVPPMMLQTLVENGIKHGISQSVEGGIIRVDTYFEGDQFIIKVINSGKLGKEESYSEAGFGLKGTRERLKLLFGDKATFNINSTGTGMVESKVTLPAVSSAFERRTVIKETSKLSDDFLSLFK